MAHVKAHYRVVNGKSIYIADHDTSAPQGAPAQIHERTVIGSHKSGTHYLRATDSEDGQHIQAAADKLGIAVTKKRAGANHLGRVGAYDHYHVESPEHAAAIHGVLQLHAGQGPAAPAAAEAPSKTHINGADGNNIPAAEGPKQKASAASQKAIRLSDAAQQGGRASHHTQAAAAHAAARKAHYDAQSASNDGPDVEASRERRRFHGQMQEHHEREARGIGATEAADREGAQHFAEGMEQHRSQTEAWKAKFPVGSKVKDNQGEVHEVMSHNGNMVGTNHGDFHATKIHPHTPAEAPAGHEHVNTVAGQHAEIASAKNHEAAPPVERSEDPDDRRRMQVAARRPQGPPIEQDEHITTEAGERAASASRIAQTHGMKATSDPTVETMRRAADKHSVAARHHKDAAAEARGTKDAAGNLVPGAEETAKHHDKEHQRHLDAETGHRVLASGMERAAQTPARASNLEAKGATTSDAQAVDEGNVLAGRSAPKDYFDHHLLADSASRAAAAAGASGDHAKAAEGHEKARDAHKGALEALKAKGPGRGTDEARRRHRNAVADHNSKAIMHASKAHAGQAPAGGTPAMDHASASQKAMDLNRKADQSPLIEDSINATTAGSLSDGAYSQTFHGTKEGNTWGAEGGHEKAAQAHEKAAKAHRHEELPKDHHGPIAKGHDELAAYHRKQMGAPQAPATTPNPAQPYGNGPRPASAPEGPTFYHGGDKVRHTGESRMLHGGKFHEIEHLDGHKKGTKGWTQRGPEETHPAAMPATHEDHPSAKAMKIADSIGANSGKSSEAHRASLAAHDPETHRKAAQIHKIAAEVTEGTPSLPQYAGGQTMSRERIAGHHALAAAHRVAARHHQIEAAKG